MPGNGTMQPEAEDAGKEAPSGSEQLGAIAQEEVSSMRLEIEPVVQRAESITAFVERDLPTHTGLARVARCVTQATRKANRVSRQLKKPIGMHRLPAVFLFVALTSLLVWAYWQFFYTPILRLAVPERDAIQLRTDASAKTRLKPIETVGSQASMALLNSGKADVAFIQGGIDIPDNWLRMELDDAELVLLYVRDGIGGITNIRKVMTSADQQGSHTLAQAFAKVWGIEQQVTYVHDWRAYTDNRDYEIDDDIDAVFVVKDPLNSKVDSTPGRLLDAGFRLVSPDIGAMQLRLDFLNEYEIRPGYLDPSRDLPEESISSYSVVTYLVARDGLSINQLNDAYRLVHPNRQFPEMVNADIGTASEIAQGVEAIFSILVYIGLTFFALLGFDVLTYRKRFHELNSLVSLISIHQSSKDVIVGSEALKAHNVTYLSVCSDLLSIISVITGYYTQENSSLMYNRLADVIHERCDGLKINIQLKILHATIGFSEESLSVDKTQLNYAAFSESQTYGPASGGSVENP